MKFLITGATGFIGNHLINELLKDKNNQIIATSRNIQKAKKLDWYQKVTYIPYNIKTDDTTNLYDFFKQPDVLIHLSWDGLPHYNHLIHIEKNIYNNYNFIKNLVANGLKKLSIVGTCLEYGIINGKLSEYFKTQPSTSYALAKDTLRKFTVELSKEFDFNYQWIRLFYLYGEGQSEKSIISLLDKAIANGDKEFDMSGGEQLRDFLPVSEVVKNIILISVKNIRPNQIINCCSGNPISIRKLVEKHLSEKKYEIRLNLGVYPYPNYEPLAFWGDNAKLLQIKKGIE